jgi:hypothetical protein
MFDKLYSVRFPGTPAGDRSFKPFEDVDVSAVLKGITSDIAGQRVFLPSSLFLFFFPDHVS